MLNGVAHVFVLWGKCLSAPSRFGQTHLDTINKKFHQLPTLFQIEGEVSGNNK